MMVSAKKLLIVFANITLTNLVTSLGQSGTSKGFCSQLGTCFTSTRPFQKVFNASYTVKPTLT